MNKLLTKVKLALYHIKDSITDPTYKWDSIKCLPTIDDYDKLSDGQKEYVKYSVNFELNNIEDQYCEKDYEKAHNNFMKKKEIIEAYENNKIR